MSPRKTMCSLSYARPDCRSVDDLCGERTVGTYIKWRTSRIMVCSSQLQEARCQWSCFQSLTSGPRRPARRSAKFSVGSQALPATHNSWEISQRYPQGDEHVTEVCTFTISAAAQILPPALAKLMKKTKTVGYRTSPGRHPPADQQIARNNSHTSRHLVPRLEMCSYFVKQVLVQQETLYSSYRAACKSPGKTSRENN
jgi:hypothetical protein